MNIWETIKNFFVGVVAKPLIEQGGDAAEKLLRKLATERPKLFKITIVGVYITAKEFGPDLVASTATDLDDKGLEELIEALETVAAEYSIDLDYETEQLKED